MKQTCQYYLSSPDRPRFKLDRKFNVLFRNGDPLAYHSKIRKYAPTPLISLPRLAKSLNIKDLYIKDESVRFRQSTFKTLGASYAINTYLDEAPGKYTFCTATDGNHGKSVAWAAQRHKQRAVIYVPEHTAEVRIKNIKRHKARVVVVKGDYDATVQQAREDARKKGYVLMQDSSWNGYTEIPTIITTGYKTILLELEGLLHTRKDPGIDFVFLQSVLPQQVSQMHAEIHHRGTSRIRLPA
jgi:diaminopropionate ammonia-lyase